MTDLCPIGGARAWISAGKSSALPDWMTEEELAMHDQILARGGFAAPLKWQVYFSLNEPANMIFPLSLS